MKKLIIIQFVILVLGLAIYAQKEKPAESTGADYDQFVSKLKAGDTKIDYKAMRVAFTESKGFSSFGGGTDYELFKLLGDKKYKNAIKATDEILKTNYVDIDAHMVCAIAYGETGDKAKADFHKAVYFGLINSIIGGADGRTAKTAYVVLSIGEENAVMRALGLMKGDQALLEEDGHKFDLIGVTNVKTKEASKIYFNIDLLWKGYDKMFGK